MSSEMANAVARVSHIEENANMLKQYKVGVIAVLLTALIGCAGGGGSAGLVQTTVSPPPTTTTTNTDKRYQFDAFSDQFTEATSKLGYNKVTYQVGEFNDTQWVNGKYTVEDFSFLQVVIDGSHAGKHQNNPDSDEYSEPGNWMTNASVVMENDINQDGHSDFLVWVGTFGDENTLPGTRMLQFVNDGSGHFKLDCSVFSNNTCPLVYGEGSSMFNLGWYNNEEAPIQAINTGIAHLYDFNNDGNKDFFNVGQLWLTDNGKFVDAHNNLPDFMFNNVNSDGVNVGLFVHDHAVGDLNGDGFNDIFMPNTTPIYSQNNGYMFFMLNDGKGGFKNTSFQVGHAGHFATSTVIADFDNDGFGDIALGWSDVAYRNLGGNSVGGIYWGNSDSDYTKDYTALPPGYYENTNIAFDIQAFDFNNDGKLDILVSNTTGDPYYDGHVLQFIENLGDRQFSHNKFIDDGATTVHGVAYIYVLDFDHDGDNDIFVGPYKGAYVLKNNGDGTYSKQSDFFAIPDNNPAITSVFPVEVDGKYEYDFVGLNILSVSETQTVTNFFISLDPPAQLQEMMTDIQNKPSGYVQSVFDAKVLTESFRDMTRFEGQQLFGKTQDSTNSFGFASKLDNFGWYVANLNGASNGSVLGIDYNYKSIRSGFQFVDNEISAFNKTKWYGVGVADVSYKTLESFLEYNKMLLPNVMLSLGQSTFYTKVDNFTEQNSTHNVNVQSFDMMDASIYSDFNFMFDNSFGKTFITASLEYFKSVKPADVKFANVLQYSFEDDFLLSSIDITHVYNNVYFKLSTNSESMNSAEIGFNFKF